MAKTKFTEAEVLDLFRQDKVTISRGAQLLGIPIQDFMDVLNANDISLDDETPEELRESLQTLEWLRKQMAAKETTEAEVLALVEKSEITASKGAELLGISIWDFYDFMYKYGVSLDDETSEELAKAFEEDRETLRALAKRAKKKVV